MLEQRWGLEPGTVAYETTSGLGTNRMTPRLVVGMIRELWLACERLDLSLADVLPVAGCDPGTLRSFRRLEPSSVIGKTGTLVYTDGGVSVLAGVARTADGEIVFCVVMPRAGRKLHWSRRQEETWLLELFDAHGGPRLGPCPAELPWPDTGAEIVQERRRPLAAGPR
jgi:D-alanyl-D-alanine carboxypeptidase